MAIVGAAMQIAFWTIVLPAAIMLFIQLFGNLVYGIGVFFFQIMDLLQSTFRKLAGLGGRVALRGEWSDGDIVTLLLKSDVVIDTLISVTIFAIGLVILASIVQMIRLEYNTEGSKNSKEQIFAKAGKSILMFIFIPIVCFVGIRLSNYILQGLDYATSSSGASTVSGSVFVAATADASKVYDSSMVGKGIDLDNLLGSIFNNESYNNPIVEPGGQGYCIKYFDDMFTTSSTDFRSEGGGVRVNLANQVAQAFTFLDGRDPIEVSPGTTAPESAIEDTTFKSGQKLSYLDVDSVSYFYKTNSINYLILFIGCYIGIKTLFTASMGLIARLYKLGALFVLAPAAIGLQPIDDGAAYKKWKGNFISNVLSCYGIIVALNLYFMLVGILQTIELWEGWIFWVPNKFIQFLFVLTGATMINELASLVSGAIGAGDVMSDGDKATKGVSDMAGKVQKFTAQPLAAGMQWAGHKVAGMVEARKKGENGEASYHDNRKAVKAAEKKLKEEEKGFASQYEEVKGKDGKVTGYKGKDGKVITADEYAKKKEEHLADSTKAVDEARTAMLSGHSGQQAAKVANHKIMGGMNLNRMMSSFNPQGLFAPMQNLIGGNGAITGKAFSAADEDYFKRLKGRGIGDDQLKMFTGKNAEDLTGSSFYGKATKTVGDRIDGVFDGMRGSAVSTVGNATEAGKLKTAQDNAKVITSRVGSQAEQSISAADDVRRSMLAAEGVRDKEGFHQASDEAITQLNDFVQKIQEFATTGNERLSMAEVKDLKTKFGEGGEYGQNDDIQRLLEEFSKMMENAGTHDAREVVAKEFSKAHFQNADIDAVRSMIETGDQRNIEEAGKGTFFDEAGNKAWQEAAALRAQGNSRRELVESEEVKSAVAHGNVDELGKILKKALGEDDGAIQAAFKEAIESLEEALKNGTIKTNLDSLKDAKLKIDDSGINSMLSDLKAAIEASAKKEDVSANTLQDLLKEMKKMNKKK